MRSFFWGMVLQANSHNYEESKKISCMILVVFFSSQPFSFFLLFTAHFSICYFLIATTVAAEGHAAIWRGEVICSEGFRKKTKILNCSYVAQPNGRREEKLQWISFFFQPQKGMLQAHDTSSLPTVTMRNKSKKTSFTSVLLMVCIFCSQLL